MKWIDIDDFCIIADYAKRHNVSVTWVNTLIKNGKLPYILHYGRKLIPISGKMPSYVTQEMLK